MICGWYRHGCVVLLTLSTGVCCNAESGKKIRQERYGKEKGQIFTPMRDFCKKISRIFIDL